MASADSTIAYYSARAAEYERIYAKPERQADLVVLKEAVASALEGLAVLEIACGTGYWTQYIATSARSVHAVDLAEEPLALARAKGLPRERVSWGRADAMVLPASLGTYQAAFAGFWWSHVPRRQIPRCLASLHARLEPGATVVLVDNLYVAGSSTLHTAPDAGGDTYQLRDLDDGSRHHVIKNFPSEAELRSSLAPVAHGIEYRPMRYYWLLQYTTTGSGYAG